MKMLNVVFFILLAGCSEAPLTKEERAVRILRKSEPPVHCKELGRVHADA